MARRKLRKKNPSAPAPKITPNGTPRKARPPATDSENSPETESRVEYDLIFEKKFGRIDREIESLRSEIRLTNGGWIFSRHVYSTQELIQSPRWEKICSISQKISDDALNWVRRGSFTEDGQAAYHKKREGVARKLRSLRKAIREREPTGWEKWMSLFEDTATMVMRILPTTANLIKLAQKLLAAKTESVGLLPAPVELD